MTISCGLCWNIDSRKIIWPPLAHFGSENESLKGLNVDNDVVCVLLSLCHCQFGRVHDIVDCQPSKVQASIFLWHTLVWCCLADRHDDGGNTVNAATVGIFRLTYFVIEVVGLNKHLSF